jgi:hypothetical protein
MALTPGRFLGYEFDRMVILFSMIDGQREIPCGISTSAMDDLEGVARSRPNQREAQFMRLRDRIEERAARKIPGYGVRRHSSEYCLAQYRLQNIVTGEVSKHDAQRDIRNSIGKRLCFGLAFGNRCSESHLAVVGEATSVEVDSTSIRPKH